MFFSELDKEIKSVKKTHEKYTDRLEGLKDKFLEEYDKTTITSLIGLVKDKGHPTEAEFVKNFAKDYESGNMDEVSIEQIVHLGKKYKKHLLKKMNEENEE